MKTLYFTISLCFFVTTLTVTAQTPSLLPKPSEAHFQKGNYVTVDIHKAKFSNVAKSDAASLKDYIAALPSSKNKGRGVVLQLSKGAIPANECERQAYTLDIDKKGARITASAWEGLFYGLQTLRQCIDENGKTPYAHIIDKPRFAYRGLMIDCSRHFWTKDFLLKQIDALASMKIDRLHLHLTDAAGWRIEIKRYPQLTEKASWRTESDWDIWWTQGDRRYLPVGQGYGGYYTQAELREIVAYAAQRNITIIPEIEMPGHSEEVCYAMPEISCSGKHDGSGDLCVGKEKTFEVLHNILDEVMDIFPSEYIHIGGDEASRRAWETCPDCQSRMREENLTTTPELQSYLTARIERYLNAHGRKLLGWDEILEGKLAPNATVMSWRGTEGGLKAVGMGHQVVMAPGAYCYLDKYQDAPLSQPKAFGGYSPLENVYSYDPVPANLVGTPSEKLILGVQACLWTEMVPTPEHCEYMIYPRVMAIAETGWSKQKTETADFRQRAMLMCDNLRARGYNPFDLHHEIGRRQESITPTTHLAIGADVKYIGEYHEAYQGQGPGTLVDGLHGNWNYSDGRWQGFIGRERFDVIIDLKDIKPIHEVKANFMQFCGPEIFAPSEVIVSVSDDGVEYRQLCDNHFDVNTDTAYFIRPYGWSGDTSARFVRFKAMSGKYGGWLFTDEVVIK